MPKYRRAYIPSGTFFLTGVTYQRTPLFSQPENITRLRTALAQTRTERAFQVLPDGWKEVTMGLIGGVVVGGDNPEYRIFPK